MKIMEKYYFKLVCVNENNPLEYEVLEDVNVATLNEVHAYVVNCIHKHKHPELTKWMLLPIKKYT